jgi:hypothetical protein
MSRLNFISNLLGYKFYIGATVVVMALFIAWHIQQVTKLKQEITNQVTLQITSEYNRKLLLQQDQLIDTQSKLNSEVQRIQYEKQSQIEAINRKHSTNLTSLLNDTNAKFARSNQTSTGDSINPESKSTDTSRGLTRKDAEFLAGYSRDSETIRQELISCYRQYDSVKQKIDDYSKAKVK